ncbi:putative type IX secretion system sortase PorU2 [Dyadobacter aurulentus]|uniref:putative type IX secretion system sortase PorU2 n=1 Tax=Dyadobacter sp. UC 10 TaxID=2605428 RepID=UPI0011F31967|nr:C25 family cysteine peptidase [Dyadobacter sp. UC 10]KAA0991239.1 T9SS type A sorting domain-containing protein [Dyadobacter sp. UC 10]
MNTKSFTKFFFLLSFGLTLFGAQLVAQTPWSGKRGNEWLAGKYNQSWLKIGVSKSGLYKVALPAAFQNKPSKLHLYRRGVEVDLVSASNTEIEFYGIPNDGASDALLYRLPTSRKNPHYSIYSDESSYFLTFDENDRTPTVQETLAPDAGVTPQESHQFTFFKKFMIEHSHMTSYPSRPATLNSYFEEGYQATGTRIFNNRPLATVNAKPTVFVSSYVAEPFAYEVKARHGSAAPKLHVRLKGRGYLFSANSTVEVWAGKDAASTELRGSTTVTGFLDKEFNADLLDKDINNGVGILGFKSTGGATDGFSVSYYSITYDQKIDMQLQNSYEFNFPASASNTRFTILNPPAGTLRFLDITVPDKPRIINGNAADMMVSRNGSAFKLYVSKDVTTVPATAVTFPAISPGNHDYLIITNEALANPAAEYAKYRKDDSPGKKYKPLVIKIKDIYNQFNYGEPSPVAIRRFVDFMVSDNNKEKFLLLLGKSITFHERAIREIPDEVPTVGFPGSDLLLVDGLGGAPDDVPVIPYGRIAAVTEQQLLDYLAKVKTYENQSENVGWRKNILHVNGGKGQDQIEEFEGNLTFIATSAKITSAPFSGKVIPKVKDKTLAANAIQYITLAPEVNGTAPGVNGVGMITYFGHGGVDITDLDFGYVMDGSKNYNNTGKYPVLFYNGCGVNNLFNNRFNLFSQPVANPSFRRPMSLDWLLAPDKGAIVVFGNDWDAYASTSNEYLDKLYLEIFPKTDAERKTIGGIVQEVALKTKLEKGYAYSDAVNGRTAAYYDFDRANVHQIILQGDPALRILMTSGPLPVELAAFEAKLVESKRVELKWRTVWETNNSHFIVERSYNAKNFTEVGMVEGKGTVDQASDYQFFDTDPLPATSYYRLKQVDKISVKDGKTVDGKVSYSQIVSVTRPDTDMLVLSPNPTRDFINIDLDAPVNILHWDVLDQKGHVYKKQGKGTKVDLSNLSSGEYIIKIQTENNDVYFRKIVKQ